MNPHVASLLRPSVFEIVPEDLLKAPEPAARPPLIADDVRGALGVFLLVFLSTFPVVIPFLLIGDPATALRVSNTVAVVMLFAGGVVARSPQRAASLAGGAGDGGPGRGARSAHDCVGWLNSAQVEKKKKKNFFFFFFLQPGSCVTHGFAGEEFDGSLAEVGGGEHHCVIPPAFVADDGDPFKAIAVPDIEGQVAPVAAGIPSFEADEDDQQAGRARAGEIQVMQQLLLNTVEIVFAEHAIDVQAINVVALVMHGRRHGVTGAGVSTALGRIAAA